MSPTGPASTAPGSAHDVDLVESLMTGEESLAAALGALLGKPMTLIEYTPPAWPAGEDRAAREDLSEDPHTSDDGQWWRRHQLILTADAEEVFFYGYVATTWLSGRIPPMARLMLALYTNEPFEQVVQPMRLSPRLIDYENLGHTHIRRRVLSRDDGVPVAVVLELLWTRDGVYLAPTSTPRPRRRGRGGAPVAVTSFPKLPVCLHLQRVHAERAAQ